MSVGEITHQQKSLMTDNMRKCQAAGLFPARFCVGECVEPARTERSSIARSITPAFRPELELERGMARLKQGKRYLTRYVSNRWQNGRDRYATKANGCAASTLYLHGLKAGVSREFG